MLNLSGNRTRCFYPVQVATVLSSLLLIIIITTYISCKKNTAAKKIRLDIFITNGWSLAPVAYLQSLPYCFTIVIGLSILLCEVALCVILNPLALPVGQ